MELLTPGRRTMAERAGAETPVPEWRERLVCGPLLWLAARHTEAVIRVIPAATSVPPAMTPRNCARGGRTAAIPHTVIPKTRNLL